MDNSAPDFFIVGIGASAGGVQTLESFFSSVMDHPNAAFVVLQHLSPDFRSMMSEILQRKTSMKVRQVEADMAVEPSTVYVMPPGKNLVLQGQRFCLVDRTEHLNYPINMFFESMAKEFAERSIGVVLTGGGSDGTEGLTAISRAGGVALAQTPNSAQFSSMPMNAISSGIVDKILDPKELARAVYDIVCFSYDQKIEIEDDDLIGKNQLKEIITLLADQGELDFSDYKTNTLKRRIQHRCALNHCSSIASYIEVLCDSEDERKLLRQSLLIGTTRFFRDGTPWPFLKEQVLPKLIDKIEPGEHLRVWVTACSTGEEAYTMAMIIDEAIKASGKELKVKIFATDIDTHSLAFTGKGIYPASIAEDISSERLKRYFDEGDNNKYQVKRFLREMLIVAPHDLTKNAGFSRMHLVSCRNVLIYMQPHLQQRVLRLLHFTLAKEGVLFLGSSETVGDYASDFEVLQSKDKIYQKKKNARKLLPHSSVRPSVATGFSANRQLKKRQVKDDRAVKAAFRYAFGNRKVTCLLVNRKNKLVRIFHNSADLLELSVGEVQMDVVDMVPQGLSLPLETALHRAKREEESVSYTGVSLRRGDEVCSVDLKIGFETGTGRSTDYFVVVLEIVDVTEADATDVDADKTTYEVSEDVAEQIYALEYELKQTKENLQVTIEELETINEEQQATNEELLASNEELQSTNEELQSVNEELYTVNAEYQRKINELVQLNEDVNNLLRSTNLGVVFLDLSLNIRKFTPAATSVISLRSGDVDRPISDFTSLLVDVDLEALAADVLRSGDRIEQEVRNAQTGEALLLRAYPYVRDDGDLDGVVLTFVEVTELKRVQSELQTTNTILETVYSTSPVGFALQDDDLRFVRVNDTLAAINNWPAKEHIGQLLTDIIPSEIGEQANAILRQVLESGEANLNCEFEGTLPTKPDEYRYWNANYFPVNLTDGRRWVASVVTEITSLKKAQDELQRSRNFARQLSESNPGIIYIYDIQERCSTYLNSSVETVLGYSPEEVIALGARLVEELVHPQDVAGLWRYFEQFEREPDGVIETEIRVRRKPSKERYEQADATGEISQWLWLALRSVVFSRNEGGSVRQVLGLATDITPRKESEERLKEQKRALESAIASAQAADSANQAKSEFLANMSHEIRTPMNLILGTSQLLERTPLNARQHNLVEVLRRNGDTLLTLINDVLDLSKLEAQELKIEDYPFNLVEMLETSLANFQPNAESKGVLLSLDLDDRLPETVMGDSFRLQQVLRNLLSNAVKFTDEGSITVGARQRSLQAGKSKIHLFVRDTGIGISTKNQANLFEPFVQSDASSTRQYGGTGLGLTICRRIVELMGGKIGVESKKGEGATFWVELDLPVVGEPPETDDIAEAAPPLPTAKPAARVLIVEDNEDNLHLLKLLLEDIAHLSLETARDGAEALEKMSQRDYDLVLMDCQMPRVDGYEATEQLRLSNRNQDVPVIALTANAMQGDREKCLAAGMDDYLSKPIVIDQLLETIDRWTDQEVRVGID